MTLRVSDDDGGVHTDAKTLRVVNVIPSLPLSGAASVAEGSEYRLTLGNVADPGTDTPAAYLIDWGDGTGTHHVPAQNLPADRTLSHVYQDGPASLSIVVKVADEDGTHVAGTKAVQVINLVPTARADAAETLEDTSILITNVLANDSDPAGAADSPTVIAITQPAQGSTVLNAGGTITYTPAANYSGADSFTYAIHDGDGGTAWGTVFITINAVNDRPSFTGGPDQTLPEDAGAVSVPGWAKNISAGPADEAGQALGFITIRVDDPTLFSVQPALAPDGTLTYTPAPNVNGSTGVAVWLQDDGGTLSGGRDTSPPYPFLITVNPVNDRPFFGGGPDQTVLRTGGTTVYSVDGWATAVSSGQANETGQTLEFQVTNDNTALFTPDGQPAIDSSGRLTYTPASDAIGTAHLTVRLRDSGGTGGGGQDVSVERTFTITVAGAYMEAGVAYVGGTKASDTIVLKPGSVIALVNGVEVGHFFGAQRVVVLGGDGNDNIQVTSSLDHSYDASHFDVSGGAGDDSITVAADLAVSTTLRGGEGNDIIRGGAGDDVITGDAGNDAMYPGLGTNTLIGGGGSNTYVPGGGSDAADPEPGATTPQFAPFVGAITTPAAPVQVGTAVVVAAEFVDLDGNDTLTATWDWGDGASTPAAPASLAGTLSASHAYSAAGVYTVRLTVSDRAGAAGVSVSRYVVVYDPTAGFVTGGGWIDSPAGAYAADATLAGRASFGFVSQYKKGGTTPSGQTQFQFSLANLNFQSTSCDWLVVSGARARYKGSGTIDGQGSYEFMITVVDGQGSGGGGVDKFRIKIWDTVSGKVVYDNQLGASDDATPTTAISGGSIVVHTKK